MFNLFFYEVMKLASITGNLNCKSWETFRNLSALIHKKKHLRQGIEKKTEHKIRRSILFNLFHTTSIFLSIFLGGTEREQ